MTDQHGPLHVTGELLATRKAGTYRVLTITAPGIPQRFRAGNFVAVSVDEGRLARRPLWIHRVKEVGAFGATLDVVVHATGPGTTWLAQRPVGTRLEITGPLGRPFALPREPVSCVLVGEGHSAAPLFALAERLRQRGCGVNLVVAGPDEARLLSALEARRSARAVTVITGDGSVGVRGNVLTHIGGILERADADVVYAAGPLPMLRAVAEAAEQRGAWSQVALETPMPCATGLCQGCPVPVVSADGASRQVRGCVDGPVIRGDRVDWRALA
ncbi:MAG: Dihydroorotate dehydrogenase electron transfer subunit [uncultured Nocardioides sp.]|uniref:Dihydroorotate dehydrogenase electron transfer subunit n=1 Tax=uncultured Nocardioides sp. TaxID=198441 RepID=A0A6J4NNT5_9ACTN|nr:MAG: Dihydroorotate dehydrogenase electron transfer subunit [uncultured Nocardioides sp.]